MQGSVENVHPIFVKDPEEWIKYVYKNVSVACIDGKDHIGWVYTVDPVSESVILCQFNENEYNIEVIIGQSIRSITILSDEIEKSKDKLDNLFSNASDKGSLGDTQKEKEKLKNWLLKNRFPVVENGEMLIVADALTINPPYRPENCISTNEIILGRIQELMKNMSVNTDDA